MKPWTERYRPITLKDVQGHHHIKDVLKSFIKQQNFPHILLHGTAGVGKTAMVRAFLKDFYGDSFRFNVIEHNASHDRGIDFIRNDLVKECQSDPSGGFEFKTIFLCEADNLTPDAQFALRRTMETHSRKVRFVSDCNEINKLIKPIRSRFAEYYVAPLNDDDIINHLLHIIGREDINLLNGKDDMKDEQIINYIYDATKGDMRSAINFLQSISHLDTISLEVVKKLNPMPTSDNVKRLIEMNRNGSSFVTREHVLQELVRESGQQCDEILKMVYEWYLTEYDGQMKPQILLEVGEFMNRMGMVYSNNVIQLRSCLERIKQIEGIDA